MIYPNYRRSIVNFASSIIKAFAGKPIYPTLPELDFLSQSQNVIFLLIDGLGYDYLQKYGQGSFLQKHCLTKITSVFPSTTATATTALETGVPAQQHASTGWFVFLKELGVVSKILPFKAKFGGESFPNSGVSRDQIFTKSRIGDQISAPSFVIYPESIVDGQVNTKSDYLWSYRGLTGMFTQIKKAVETSNKRKFIYAYLPDFDTLCHEQGTSSTVALDFFKKLDKKIITLTKSLSSQNFTFLATADHGQITTNSSKVIFIQKDYPDLYDMLTLPLCGEPRVAYCYVHPDQAKSFVKYVKSKLKFCCQVYSSKDLIKRNFFGLFEPNPKLYHRVGDYILIMKDNYIIKDFLINQEEKYDLGNHGGLSHQEMYVPLIIYSSGSGGKNSSPLSLSV